jgi:ketosteroid isomerase-like protein
MTGTDVRHLVEHYRAGWFGQDADAIMAVVSEDVVFHNVTTAAWNRRDQLP